MIAASNFEIFKIAGNEYSFVYNGFASSTGRQIGSTYVSKNWAGVSRASLTCLFVWTAQKSSPIYLRQAIALTLGPSGRLCYEEQWESLRTRCTNLSLGRLAELRPSYDPNDWQANQNNEEWKDLTIKVYGSDANDLISDGDTGE